MIPIYNNTRHIIVPDITLIIAITIVVMIMITNLLLRLHLTIETQNKDTVEDNRAFLFLVALRF